MRQALRNPCKLDTFFSAQVMEGAGVMLQQVKSQFGITASSIRSWLLLFPFSFLLMLTAGSNRSRAPSRVGELLRVAEPAASA